MGSYFCAAVKVVVQEVTARLVVLVQGIDGIVVDLSVVIIVGQGRDIRGQRMFRV